MSCEFSQSKSCLSLIDLLAMHHGHQIYRVMVKNHPNHNTSLRDVGSCFNRMFCSTKAWKKLMVDEANRSLSPYNLRHGYSGKATFGETRMAMSITKRLSLNVAIKNGNVVVPKIKNELSGGSALAEDPVCK